MAKIEEAYSIEYDDIIDSEKAYELFWDGIISDGRAFQCTDLNCEAQITCANIDKKRAQMKKRPYFVCYGEHSTNCKVMNEFEERERHKGKIGYNKNIGYLDNEVDILDFNRPKIDSIISKTEKELDKNDIRRRKKKIYEDNKSKININRYSKYYSIKPLISKYLSYESNGSLTNHFINVKGYNISYKKMFLNIEKLFLKDTSKYFRIYYGVGKIVKSNKDNGDFIVFFKNGFKDEKVTTSIYINNNTINKNYRKVKWRETLDDLCKINDKEIMFYINSKPNINRNIINLPLLNMDFFDYRIIND